MPVSIDERLWLSPARGDQSRASDDVAKNSMAALVGRVVGAKPFPETARRLAEMTRSPNARIGNAVRVLETDPALSARLLRLVNSPGYALRMRCTSLRHAAALVGLERLNHIATTAAVLDMFGDHSEAANRLLDHSTIVGAFCRYFAVSFSLPAEELFTCGFLHDIGKLLLLETEGESYAELLSTTKEPVIHEAERARFGYDHAVLCAHVLSAWNIPDPVPVVVAWHHDTQEYEGEPEVAAMIEILRLSDEIAHLMGTMSDQRALQTIAASETAARLNLGQAELPRIWQELRALREHCRAQRSNESRFVDVTSIRPTASLPPPSANPISGTFPSAKPGSPVPSQPTPSVPTCHLCEKPSDGGTCAACDETTCTEHLESGDGFCAACADAFERSRGALGNGLALKLGISAAFVSLLLGAGFGAMQNGVSETLRLLLSPVIGLAISGALLGLAQRWIVRSRFQRGVRESHARAGAESEAEPEIEHRSAPEVAPALAESAESPDSGPVLTIPPSAYKLAMVPGLLGEALPRGTREALLGSSHPPEPAPSSQPNPIAIQAEMATRPAPEENRDLPPNPLGEAPQPLPAAQRAVLGAAFRPRRGPRRVRVPRRRD